MIAELTQKQRMQGLSPLEQDELLTLVDDIELLNAKQLGYLAELANLRQITLDELIRRMELAPITYG